MENELVVLMFKRGREYERGLCPLSTLLPSPANKNQEYSMILAGEGQG